jgi:hypothetical protein
MIAALRRTFGDIWLLAMIGVIVVTGTISILLEVFASQTAWSTPLQTILAIAAAIVCTAIIVGRLSPSLRLQAIAIAAPALGLIVLGMLFFPDLLALFIGGALGWIVAGTLVFRNSRAPVQYRQAIRALRRNDLEQAITLMSMLIKEEPDVLEHYRFRADLLRLARRFSRAEKDYTRMTALAPQDPVGYNGLAEIALHQGNLEEALQQGLKAHELSDGQWVTAYNLGMVYDRMKNAPDALRVLDEAWNARVPESRHRLLIQLYRARAFARLGDAQGAADALGLLRKEQAGLRDWRSILEAPAADSLRDIIVADVDRAERLVEMADDQAGNVLEELAR